MAAPADLFTALVMSVRPYVRDDLTAGFIAGAMFYDAWGIDDAEHLGELPAAIAKATANLYDLLADFAGAEGEAAYLECSRNAAHCLSAYGVASLRKCEARNLDRANAGKMPMTRRGDRSEVVA